MVADAMVPCAEHAPGVGVGANVGAGAGVDGGVGAVLGVATGAKHAVGVGAGAYDSVEDEEMAGTGGGCVGGEVSCIDGASVGGPAC